MASGLIERTIRIFHARFHFGSGPLQPLTLLGLLTRWIILQQARSRTFQTLLLGIVLLQLVDVRFQVLFHSPLGVLFAFPSRYWFTIGCQRVFSLGEWSPRFPTGLHVPSSTQVLIGRYLHFRLKDCHPLWLDFPDYSANVILGNFPALNRMSPITPPHALYPP